MPAVGRPWPSGDDGDDGDVGDDGDAYELTSSLQRWGESRRWQATSLSNGKCQDPGKSKSEANGKVRRRKSGIFE